MNEKLNIITPVYRFENLELIYDSLPDSENIIWHISKSNKREEIISDKLLTDERVKIYNVNCHDNEPFYKRIHVLNLLSGGYFCFIDDDTIFHPNMFELYTQLYSNNFIGMAIGQQLNKRNNIRLQAHVPKYTRIDTGNVIAHTKCLEKVNWPTTFKIGISQRDSIFWSDVYKYYNNECILLTEPISYYNFLR